jgi:GAF domain-containing protein
VTDTGDRHTVANPLRPLLDVAEALVSSLVLEEALTNTAAAIGRAMSVSKVDIYAYDRERDVLVFEAKWDVDGLTPEKLAVVGSEIDLRARPSWRQILEGNVVELHINDPELPPEERAIYERYGQKTTLDAPLMVGGEVIGVMGVVQRDRIRRFTPLETDLFEEFCRIAAIGISNAKTFRRLIECDRHLEALIAVGAAITSSQDRDSQLEVVCGAATEALDIAAAGIFAPGTGRDAIVCRARHQRRGVTVPALREAGAPGASPVPGKQRETFAGEGAVIRRLHDADVAADLSEAMELAGAGVCLDVPLHFGGDPVGLLRLSDPRADRRFTDSDMRLVESLAMQAATVLSRDR